MHRTNRNTRSILAAAITLAALGSAAHATDGTWTAGGTNTSWSNPANWAGGIIADGADGTAIVAFDLTNSKGFSADPNRTIGHLSFSDTNPATAGSWIVNGTGPLVFAVSAGTPTVAVNSLAPTGILQFNIALAGTQGLQLTGSGTIVDTPGNTYTGGLIIDSGVTYSVGAGYIPATAAATLATSDAVTVNGTLLLRASANTNVVAYSLSGSGNIGTDASAPSGAVTLRVKQGTFSGNITDGPGGSNATPARLALNFDSASPGLIDLSGVNTYTGDTLVRTGGTLRLSSTTALPDNSFLRLESGVNASSNLELNAGGDFYRKLSTTSFNGGISIGSNNTNSVVNIGTIGQDRKVTFTDGNNNNPVTIVWNDTAGNFIPDVFGLSTPSSTNTINFTNPINLNGAARVININNGSAAIDAELSGSFSNSSATAAGLTLNGTGTLLLSGDNSASTSLLTINTPIVRLSSSTSLGTLTTVTGGTFTGRIELTDGQNISSPISVGGRQLAASLAPAISGVSGNSTYSGTLTTSSGGNLYNISSEAGSLTIAGTINNLAGSGRSLQFMGAAGQGYVTSNIQSSLTVNKYGNSTWTLSGPSNTYTGATSVFAGTLVLASSQTATSSITISDGALLKVAAGSNSTIKTTTITATGSGALDLADNKLVFTAGNYIDLVRGLLSFGYNNGSWTGPGITSSSAANDSNHTTAIGYALASDLGVSTWGSASVTSGNTVAKYTYFGDANLDGTVNADDYALLDRSFAKSTSNAHWTNGDFNYDGIIDSNDYLLIDTSYALQSGALDPSLLASRESQFGEAYVQSLIASVPEPTSLLAACGFALPLLTRRRIVPGR